MSRQGRSASPIRRVGGVFLITSGLFTAVGCGDPMRPPPPTAPRADLRVEASGEAAASLGRDIAFSVTATNGGPDRAEEVDVSAALSGSFDPVFVSDGGAISGGTVTWPTEDALASQASAEFEVIVRPTSAGDVTIVAMASSATDDPEPGNNDGSAAAATATTRVELEANLRITSDAPTAADGGDTIVVTLTATNGGPSDAAEVVVTDSLPAGLEVVSVSDGGILDGSAIDWPAVATLAAGASVEYQVTFVVPAVGPYESVHRVVGSAADPTLANNREVRRTLVTATPLRTIEGEIAGESYGWEVEPIGDVTGDGLADFAVAAPFGNRNGAGSGSIYIVSGADGSEVRRFDGEPSDWLGIDVDWGADFDGDGVPELVVGAPAADGAAAPGRVYVFSLVDGSTVQTLVGENDGDRFGWSASPAGDVNGDGTPDLYVGARDADAGGANSGRAYVFSGADWSVLWTADGETSGDLFGQAGGGVGDVNGDGFDDVAVGAPDWNPNSAGVGRGRVYVLSGETGEELYPSIAADGTGIEFGAFWVFGLGDVGGDGAPDIFASDLSNQAGGAGTGRVYVFSGSNGSPILTLTGESSGDEFGVSHPAGDLDGDGLTDFSVAAWRSAEGASQGGKVYLYSSATGAVLRTITSTTAGENFGFDAFVIGDVTGDGIPDIAVSGGISESTAGHVKLYAGLAP